MMEQGRRVFKRVFRGAKRKRTEGTSLANSGYTSSHTRSRMTLGRVLPQQTLVNRLVAAAVNKVTYVFKGLDPDFDGAKGYYWLSNNIVTATGVHDWPVYALNLTNVFNDGLPSPTPLWRLTSTMSTSGFFWQQQGGQSSLGGSTYALGVKESPYGGATSNVGAKSLLAWVRARLNLYGQTTRPTTVTVQIVSFKHANLCPEAPTVVTDPVVNGYWGPMLKNALSNPAAATARFVQPSKVCTVLATKEIKLSPTQSAVTDDDNPVCHSLDLFFRANKVLNFVGARGPSITDADLNSAALHNVLANSDAFDTRPAQSKDNLYLIIKSSHYTQRTSADATCTNAQAPSFDLNCEMSHRILEAN